MKKKNPVWGARLKGTRSDIMDRINPSIEIDKRLYVEDIEASVVHCQMLVKQKIISKSEGSKITLGLKKILQEIKKGKMKFNPELEDIHMNIEFRLKQLIGESAGKLHIARSRNDQIATDFKLWIKKSINAIDSNIVQISLTLVKKAEKHVFTVMPGLTHLQNAQPVSFAHHLLSYYEMFKRDRARFSSVKKRLNKNPLGTGALAGTSFPIDRMMTTKKLGFDSPTTNSIDSVSDRDFVIDFLFGCSVCSMHLSRLAEDIIFWSSSLVNFTRLSDNVSTGSSMMPQKRNPDSAELVRGKTGQIFSSLYSILTVMKALPLSYSKDMQEDKKITFETYDNLNLCIETMNEVVKHLQINKKSMENAALIGYTLATDLTEWLVKNLNLSFRDAHSLTGQIVNYAEKNRLSLAEINLSVFRKFHPQITKNIYKVFNLKNSIESKKSFGGTAPQLVKKAIVCAKKELK